MEPKEIKKIRKDMGLTVAQFATYMGISPQTVDTWEMGTRNPDNYKLTTLYKLRERLDQLPPKEIPQFTAGLKVAGAIGLGALLVYLFSEAQGGNDE
jgi:transcriptional regulator with XRE-family HTH domain